MTQTCSSCNSTQLQWKTVREHVPFDVLYCTACEEVLAQDDWDAPLLPIDRKRCLNCGGHYANEVCDGCGLSYEEVLQVHDELRDLIDPNLGHQDYLKAVRQALWKRGPTKEAGPPKAH